jgi:3-hydroxyacyl-CoA dehydrogenase/enoyl-CoA hydratase/3-hydroxybutyryl-CoA epimerase/enoyl-CoA isomerase
MHVQGRNILFQGETIQVSKLDEGFVELCFNRRDAAINKLDRLTIDEWREATKLIAGTPGVRGVLMTSAKEVFIVGADIDEFGALFRLPHEEMVAVNLHTNDVITSFEDLAVPIVAAINGVALDGVALDGGLEVALTAALRVMSTSAQVGLPEVNLGLLPGAGGTLRLPRVPSPAVAIDRVAHGKPSKAAAAKEAGVVDEVCASEALRETALALLRKAADGDMDWRARQQKKRVPVALDADAPHALFTAAKARVAAGGARHQPAALAALEMMEQAAGRDCADA